jgi:adenylate kinase
MSRYYQHYIYYIFIMKMFSIIGVSGSGKGSIIKGLQEKIPNLKQISLTRLLMQHFEIISVNDVIHDFHYIALEKISQQEKYDAMNSTEFLKALLKESERYNVCVCEVHFVIPVRNTDETVTYFEQPPALWFEKLNNCCIYLQNEASEVVLRKQQDALTGKRDRGSSTLTLESTKMQIAVSNEVWEKYKRQIQIPYLELENPNQQLDITVNSAFEYVKIHLL